MEVGSRSQQPRAQHRGWPEGGGAQASSPAPPAERTGLLCPLPTPGDGPGPPAPRGPWQLRARLWGGCLPSPALCPPGPPGIHSPTAGRQGVPRETASKGPLPQPQGSPCSLGPGADAGVGGGECPVSTFPAALPSAAPPPRRPLSPAPPQPGRRCVGSVPAHPDGRPVPAALRPPSREPPPPHPSLVTAARTPGCPPPASPRPEPRTWAAPWAAEGLQGLLKPNAAALPQGGPGFNNWGPSEKREVWARTRDNGGDDGGDDRGRRRLV